MAYADFVTAMMALFMVLWLTSQDQRIKEAVQRAFRNPFSSVTKDSTGVIPNKDTQAVKASSGNFDSASPEPGFVEIIAERCGRRRGKPGEIGNDAGWAVDQCL